MEGHQIVQYCFSSDNTSCPKETQSTVVYVILYIFCISVVMLTVCGNLMVIISISHFKQLHTPTNLLLLSLAVTDFLIGLIVMPFEMIRYIETCWYFGRTFCMIFYLVLGILTFVSLINVVFISIDRYVAVCDPLRYSNKITVNVTCFCVKSCLGECVFEMSAPWAIVDMLATFILPCSVMMVLYMKIFIVAKRHAQVIGSVTEQLKSERKAAKTLGTVVAVFLLCWMPYYIGSIVEGSPNASSSAAVINGLICLANLNSAVNPIIYALFYPWFQKSVKAILTFRICDPSSVLNNLFPENH
nr:PREDICTED: trace amine-associated receptor 13c-like [Lepisosteus oculatus]